eukprot:symbB.v1.2.004525.t1/scaffold257.1/size249567/6
MSHAWTGELDKASDAKSWGNLRFPVLEMFFFRRVIFDELHELVGDPKGDLSAMHHLRSSHFWGLTATPLLSSTRHVSQMAALLRIDVAGPGSHSLLDSDLVLVENCQRFLDACVRRNTAEVPKIQVKQHLRLVKHTPQESLGERVKGESLVFGSLCRCMEQFFATKSAAVDPLLSF